MKTDLLFDVEESKSPRLQWLEKHGIVTYLNCPHDPELRLWMAGFAKWADGFRGMTSKRGHADFEADLFFHETSHNGESRMGYGDTEHEALVSFAKRWDLLLWNEEDAK